jgi:D-alanyl-D-alanine carboxypeptidase
MDDLSSRQRQFSLCVSKLIKEVYDRGYSCTLAEAFRTVEQAAIYAKEGKGIIDSLHCKRLAIDINLFSPSGIYLSDTSDYDPFGRFWENMDKNLRWGGNFKDRPDGNHFEMKYL